VRHLQIADVPVETERTVGGRLLEHDRRSDGPAVVDVDAECRARPVLLDVVVVLLDARGIVDRYPRGREDAIAAHVVDVTGSGVRPADEAHGGALRERQVQEALREIAEVTFERRGRELVPGVESIRVGLVRDDADRSRLRARAVQRALRTREDLDARDVVDLDVERTLDRRDGLFVEVHADGRQRSRVVRVLAARDAAHVRTREAGSRALIRNVRQEFHVVAEVVDLELRELGLADRLDAERNVLQAFRALLRGDDDFLEPDLFGLLCLSDADAREHCTGNGQGTPHCSGEGQSIVRDVTEIVAIHEAPRIFMVAAASAAISDGG
jgi:hypothetical protein